ncbi:MAG: FAD-dependent oxidoreductase [Pseudomonadota bacterium]
MPAQEEAFPRIQNASTPRIPVIVVGGGPAGLRAARQLSAAGKTVFLFNAESDRPYNRVKLTPLLAGDVQFGDILLPESFPGPGEVTVFHGTKVVKIDRDAKSVTTSDGGIWPYQKLILATGSVAHVPGIPGKEKSGVFTFRDSSDAASLMARSFSARDVVVVGGGLLGLEAARGMQRRGASVTIIEHEGRLMPRQLDAAAAEQLQARIEALGVTVRCGVAVAELLGEDRVESVRLKGDAPIPADTVILCTGVRANTWLARDSGLAANRGIMVNDAMQTTDPAIYAVGECCEHREVVYGLVGPGLEQADVAASQISGEPVEYTGTAPATKLKVLGADVFSAGPVETLEQEINTRSHVWCGLDGSYRRVFLTRGRLSGAMSVGPWDEVGKLQQSVSEGVLVYPWMIFRFRQSGRLWPQAHEDAVGRPPDAIVCNCTGVSCGLLRDAIARGAVTVEALRDETGASSVCGTCAPQLEELIEAGGPAKPLPMFRALLALSALAAVLALANALLPRVPAPDSWTLKSLVNFLWFDTVTKQWTGYTLLGLTVAAMLIGLRKRIRLFDRLGSYDSWRVIHLGIGVAAVVGLFIHTGFRPGSNLNFWLFFSFSAALIFGAISGLATGGDHKLRDQGLSTTRNPARRAPLWLHVIALWPLPVLLLLHVLTVYAF